MTELSEELRHFRLVTGEDIIAQVLFEDQTEITLGHPMKIVLLPVDKGSYRISMMEWIFSKVSPFQTFTIKDRDILTTSDPSDDMVEYYWEAMDLLAKKRAMIMKEESKKDVDKVREIEEYLDELEDQIQEEGGDADFVRNLLNSLTSNNKGTLH